MGDAVAVSVGVGVSVSVGVSDGVAVSIAKGKAVIVKVLVGNLNRVGVAVTVGVSFGVIILSAMIPEKKQRAIKNSAAAMIIPREELPLRFRASYFF